MHIGFHPPQAWQEFNDRITAKLGLDKAGGMAMFTPGVGAALAELTLGLARQYPHRKKVYYVKSCDPALEEAALQLSKEGCQILAMAPEILDRPQEISSLIDGATLLILAAADDPLLGRVFDLAELTKVTEAQKAFLIRVSHATHFFAPRPEAYSRFRFEVWHYGPELAIILTSSRVKWPSQFANRIPPPPPDIETRVCNDEITFDEALVRRFEASPPSGAKPVFDERVSRVFDRAVVFWEDLDGWAVATRLAEELGLTLPPAGHATPLEATSLNRWRGVRTMDWLYDLGFSPEMIRGTLILDQTLLRRGDLQAAMDSVCSEIRKIQVGP